jgi:hypothetical protein
MAAQKTFIVQQNVDGKVVDTEVKAERAETEGQGSTRVTFLDGDEPVASFINLIGWYVKTK